jgi:hypothetical protein
MNIEQMLQLEKQQKENISEYLDAWFNKLSQRECLDDKVLTDIEGQIKGFISGISLTNLFDSKELEIFKVKGANTVNSLKASAK